MHSSTSFSTFLLQLLLIIPLTGFAISQIKLFESFVSSSLLVYSLLFIYILRRWRTLAYEMIYHHGGPFQTMVDFIYTRGKILAQPSKLT